jgi:hypothetical protein
MVSIIPFSRGLFLVAFVVFSSADDTSYPMAFHAGFSPFSST